MLVPRNEMHNNKQCCLRFGLMKKKARKAPNFKKETKKRKYFSLLHEIKRKISFRKMKQRQSGITTTDPKVDFRTVQKRWRQSEKNETHQFHKRVSISKGEFLTPFYKDREI